MLRADQVRILSGSKTIVTVMTDHNNWQSANVLKLVGGAAGDYWTPLGFSANAIVGILYSANTNTGVQLQDQTNNEAVGFAVWGASQFTSQKESVEAKQDVTNNTHSPIKVSK